MPFVSSDPDKPKGGRPPKTPLFYQVTFEHDTQAPLTISGEIIASSPHRGVYLAVKDARSRAKGFRWSSLTVLLDKTRRR